MDSLRSSFLAPLGVLAGLGGSSLSYVQTALGQRVRPWRFLVAAGACVLSLAACKVGGDDGDAGPARAPCGAPAGDWHYVLSCDYTFSGLVHQCTDFYATASAYDSTEQSLHSLCSALTGKVLSGLCPATGSSGSCVESAASGPLASATQGAIEQIYSYDSSYTPAESRADCEGDGGVYVAPDGSVPALPAGHSTSACKNTGAGSGSDVFSYSTYVNGEVIECTSYRGKVTQQELESVLGIGARTEPCPTANAVCSCPQASGTGPFGTTYTLVYYSSSIDPAATCPNTDASCKPGYAGN